MSWFKLKSVPINNYYGATTTKNQNEFVYASACGEINRNYPRRSYIHTYNVNKNEWYKEFTYPAKKLNFSCHSVAIKEKQNKIYLSTPRHLIIELNTDTKQYKMIDNIIYSFKKRNILNINGNIHLVSNEHLIFNEENNTFTQIYDFGDLPRKHYIDNLTVIYIPSKQILLLFRTLSKECNEGKIQLWKFNLQSNQWSKIKTFQNTFKISTAVLTSNQQFVIFYSPKEFAIYALHITNNDDYKLVQCNISSPIRTSSELHIQRTGGGIEDEMLTFGWIKQLFQTSVFQHMKLPPLYIMKFILMWYSRELIHLIHDNTNSHFAIELKHILSSK